MDILPEYQQALAAMDAEQEARCRRCGRCCGHADDPCRHLLPLAGGGYRCTVYADRLREHMTRHGQPFRCVPIRELIRQGWPGVALCAYGGSEAFRRVDGDAEGLAEQGGHGCAI